MALSFSIDGSRLSRQHRLSILRVFYSSASSSPRFAQTKIFSLHSESRTQWTWSRSESSFTYKLSDWSERSSQNWLFIVIGLMNEWSCSRYHPTHPTTKWSDHDTRFFLRRSWTRDLFAQSAIRTKGWRLIIAENAYHLSRTHPATFRQRPISASIS